jgi:hypothetical protein
MCGVNSGLEANVQSERMNCISQSGSSSVELPISVLAKLEGPSLDFGVAFTIAILLPLGVTSGFVGCLDFRLGVGVEEPFSAARLLGVLGPEATSPYDRLLGVRVPANWAAR